MSDYESWKTSIFGNVDDFEKLENCRAVFSKISPLFASFYENEANPTNYATDVSNVLAKMFPNSTIPNISDFKAFTQFVFDNKDTLNPNTIDGIKNLMQYINTDCNIFRPIWEFAETANDPHMFLKILSAAFQRGQEAPLKLNIYVTEMLFDHYCPMIEPTNIIDEQAIFSRIELINALIQLSEFLTQGQDIENNKIVSLFRTITRTAKRCKGYISIEAFRLATSLFKSQVMKLAPKVQADELMRFCGAFSRNHILHYPAIRFAITVHPDMFGFVSLAKNIINGGIFDQNDISILSRILHLKYVKNPTDVFSYLYKLSTSHKILANCARITVIKAFSKYESILDLKNNTKQLINRLVEFISYALKAKKYSRRVDLALLLISDFYSLELAWLKTYIEESCANGIEYGNIPREMFSFCAESAAKPDEKMKHLFEIDVSNVNLKEYVEKGSDAVTKPEPVTSKPGSARRVASKKPTIAEVKAMYKQKMAQGKFTPANDRSLLKAACACKNSSSEEEEDLTRD